MCRRFGTHCLFHLHRRVGMKNDWVSEILGYLYRKMFGSKIAWANKERRQPPKTQQFDLYHPMAHLDTRPISFTYAPVASMWVVALHNLFLYSDLPLPCHPPSDWLRLFSSQTFSRTNTPTFSNLVILNTYPSMKMEQSVLKCWHIKFRRWGITQKRAYNNK